MGRTRRWSPIPDCVAKPEAGFPERSPGPTALPSGDAMRSSVSRWPAYAPAGRSGPQEAISQQSTETADRAVPGLRSARMYGHWPRSSRRPLSPNWLMFSLLPFICKKSWLPSLTLKEAEIPLIALSRISRN